MCPAGPTLLIPPIPTRALLAAGGALVVFAGARSGDAGDAGGRTLQAEAAAHPVSDKPAVYVY